MVVNIKLPGVRATELDEGLEGAMPIALAKRLRVDGVQALSEEFRQFARDNIGLGSASTKDVDDFVEPVDLTDATTDTTGLTSILALKNDGTIIRSAAAALASILLGLSGPIKDAAHHVTDPDNAATTTVELQALIDGLAAGAGGTIFIGKKYSIQASVLAETYSNEGADVAASTGCLVLRSNVQLVGYGKHSGSWLSCADPTKTLIFLVAPQNCSISGIRLSNGWDYLESGAGHGVLVLATQGMADTTCRNVTINDVMVEHVGSYGLGFQNGYPQNCVVQDVEIFYTGADGLDLKARGDSGEARGNYVTNVTVRKHGNRVTGSAGVDIRGVWFLKNITVTEFGDLNNAIFYSGIRFRSKPPVGSGYPDGSKSSLHGFRIDCSALAVGATANALECGSDDVQIAAGVINGGSRGIVLSGNVDGVSNRIAVSGVTVYGTALFNFFVGSGCEKTVFSSCFSRDAVGVGFRNEGNNTVFIGCRSDNDATAKSSSTTGADTEVALGSSFSADFGFNFTSPAAGRMAIQPKGTSATIDLELAPKGATGRIRTGYATTAATTPASFTADRILEIKDSSGNVYRIPCRSAAW